MTCFVSAEAEGAAWGQYTGNTGSFRHHAVTVLRAQGGEGCCQGGGRLRLHHQRRGPDLRGRRSRSGEHFTSACIAFRARCRLPEPLLLLRRLKYGIRRCRHQGSGWRRRWQQHSRCTAAWRSTSAGLCESRAEAHTSSTADAAQ